MIYIYRIVKTNAYNPIMNKEKSIFYQTDALVYKSTFGIFIIFILLLNLQFLLHLLMIDCTFL